MLEFQEKRKLKNFIYSKVTLVFLIIVIAILLNAVWDIYKKQDITMDNLNKTATTFDDLKKREKILSAEIEKLKTDSGKEEEIREKYGLVKPGEEVIVVVDSNTSTEVDINDNEGGFWQKIINWFK